MYVSMCEYACVNLCVYVSLCVCGGWREGGRQFHINKTKSGSMDFFIDVVNTQLASYPRQLHKSVEIQSKWFTKDTTHVSFQLKKYIILLMQKNQH